MHKNYIEGFLSIKEINKKLPIEIPSTCPYCHKIMKPEIISYTNCTINSDTPDYTVYKKFAVVYSCTYCESFYLEPYQLSRTGSSLNYKYEIEGIEYEIDFKEVNYDLPDEINKISKSFKKIYMQSLKAEEDNLNEISGIGFRKSLEFLIKDYLINFLKEDENVISKIPLSQAINMIDSNKIKNLALATTWLGNDEAHYKREYTNKDVKDIKRFLKALASYITYEIVSTDAEDMIISKKLSKASKQVKQS